jgi:hypothetical protein
MRRLFATAAAVAMLVATHPSPAAALIVRPKNELFFSVPVTGTPNPYTLYLLARNVGSGANDYLDVWFGRTATTGNKPQQTHYYDISGVTMTCTTGMGSCEVDSGSQMGSLGQIHLYYTASSQPATIHHACPTDLGNAYDERRRTGQVTGHFELATGTSYFKTIKNTSSAAVHIPASITTRSSELAYGSSCNSTAPCTSQLFVGVSTPVGAISAYQFPKSGVGTVEFDFYGPMVAGTEVRHQVLGQATVTVLHVTSNTPRPLQKISVSLPFQPFLSGSGTFTGSGTATVSSYPGCRETDRNGSFTGNFTAHLDGWGAKAFNGTNTAGAQHFVPQP